MEVILNWALANIYCLVGLAIFLIALTYIFRDPPKPCKHKSEDQMSDKIKTKNYHFEMIPTNGIKLHTFCAGDPKNPLLILLHGCPEFWRAWDNQIDDFVNAGFYVMAPDQRGYNLSSKPLNVGDYKLSLLGKDIVGLIDHAKKEKAYLAGHDWGAGIAWHLAITYPERFIKAITLNVPHLNVLADWRKNDPDQAKRSGYINRIQPPFLPQYKAAANNFLGYETMLLKGSNPGAFTSEDIRAYRLAWHDRGTINCMYNWYRANVLMYKYYPKDKSRVHIPMKIMWGVNDVALKKEMAPDCLKYCDDGQIQYVEGATHWLLHEKPEIINKSMIEFFKSK